MTVAADRPRSARKTLAVCGGAHALHDGFTDLLNVLYPLLQSQFGLSYAAIGALKAVYSGAMASGQIPSGWLAGRFGGVKVLASGTALIAVGYGLAGFTGSLYGVVAGLLLAGLGGATQHPIASTLVASAFRAAFLFFRPFRLRAKGADLPPSAWRCRCCLPEVLPANWSWAGSDRGSAS